VVKIALSITSLIPFLSYTYMIIGITGTNGSGKGTVVAYLVEEKNFHHYSVRDFLTTKLRHEGRPINRSEMRNLANDIRSRHDPAYIIRHLHEQSLRDGVENAVIESVRNVGEVAYLLLHKVFLLAVDADQKMRFARVQERRSETDRVDFETFVHHEEREMHPEGPHDMDVRGVMRQAHATIINESSREDLHARVDKILTYTFL
jgi:dephospho-CoA kinase